MRFSSSFGRMICIKKIIQEFRPISSSIENIHSISPKEIGIAFISSITRTNTRCLALFKSTPKGLYYGLSVVRFCVSGGKIIPCFSKLKFATCLLAKMASYVSYFNRYLNHMHQGLLIRTHAFF